MNTQIQENYHEAWKQPINSPASFDEVEEHHSLRASITLNMFVHEVKLSK